MVGAFLLGRGTYTHVQEHAHPSKFILFFLFLSLFFLPFHVLAFFFSGFDHLSMNLQRTGRISFYMQVRSSPLLSLKLIQWFFLWEPTNPLSIPVTVCVSLYTFFLKQNAGEEGLQIGCSAGLSPTDMIFGQVKAFLFLFLSLSLYVQNTMCSYSCSSRFLLVSRSRRSFPSVFLFLLFLLFLNLFLFFVRGFSLQQMADQVQDTLSLNNLS